MRLVQAAASVSHLKITVSMVNVRQTSPTGGVTEGGIHPQARNLVEFLAVDTAAEVSNETETSTLSCMTPLKVAIRDAILRMM